MRTPPDNVWWVLLVLVLSIVSVWPPSEDHSLVVKFINWAADPLDRLPPTPGPIPFGHGDDVEAVNAHDALTYEYDTLYQKGGWTRTRLELKDWRDPFSPATERQLLIGVGLVAALWAWRASGQKRS